MLRVPSPTVSRSEKAMTDADLAATIDAAWEARDTLAPQTHGA